MDLRKITPDPDLYRAVTPDDPDIIQKPLQRPTRARRGDETRLEHSACSDFESTALRPFQGPTGANTGPVGSEE